MTAAAEAGATVLNFAEVVDLRIVAGRVAGAEVRDRLSGEAVSVEARAVVNATGPWLETSGDSRTRRRARTAGSPRACT